MRSQISLKNKINEINICQIDVGTKNVFYKTMNDMKNESRKLFFDTSSEECVIILLFSVDGIDSF